MISVWALYKWCVQMGIRVIKQSSRKCVLQIGIRAKVLTLSLDGPVERSLHWECEWKLGLEDQFRTLVCCGVSSSCLTVLTSLGSIATSETADGVVYSHRETGLYTNGVRTLGSVREGRGALVTVESGKMCVGIKIPFEIHRNVEIAICKIPNWLGTIWVVRSQPENPSTVGSVGRCPKVKPQRLGAKAPK